MLEVQHITKIYNPGTVHETCLFKDFSLKIEQGSFASVVGSNGSGKTSLLNILCGSIPVEQGKILMDNADITKVKEFRRYRRMGRVYQNPAMGTCPTMNILETYHGRQQGQTLQPDSRHQQASHRGLPKLCLRRWGWALKTKWAFPWAPSGGQRQALALLMATMNPIDFLILDEHTAALDPKTAEIIMELTAKIVAEKHLTTLMVTHNLRHALTYGDRLLMLHAGQVVLDRSGEEKQATQLDDILGLFNAISIECGN